MKTLRQKISTLDKELTAIEEYTQDEQIKLKGLCDTQHEVVTFLMVSGFICGFIYSYRKSLSEVVSGLVQLNTKINPQVALLRKLNIL